MFIKESTENNTLKGVQGHRFLCFLKGDMCLNRLKNSSKVYPSSQKALGKVSVMPGSLIC